MVYGYAVFDPPIELEKCGNTILYIRRNTGMKGWKVSKGSIPEERFSSRWSTKEFPSRSIWVVVELEHLN